jgi:MYXO-CTERM domain-containing protein
MRKRTIPWRELGIASLLVAFNFPFVVKFGGLSSGPSGWTAFAQGAPYTPTETPTATPTATPTITPPHENTGGASWCSDGIDNDGNGLIDCEDPACANVPPCPPAAPVVSRGGLAAGVFLLLLVGAFGLRRRRRHSV